MRPNTQIIGAPAFFSTVWGWIKRWFDPVTVSKIFILSHHEVFPVLSSFLDPKNIPKQYGGELDFKWGQAPNLDPKIKELATWENGFTEFPTGPIYWVLIEGGTRMEAVARGSVDKQQRDIKVCSIPVAYPVEPKKEEETPPATNGEAVPSVPPPTETPEAPVKSEEPAVVDSAKETPISPVSPNDEEFEDASEEPLKSPAIAEIQGVQNLSLHDPEKAAAVEPLPNGKAEAAL